MRDIVVSKNKDYGAAPLLVWGEFGIPVRMHDKMERIRNMLMTGAHNVLSETVVDTMLDLANYAILELMRRHDWLLLPYADGTESPDKDTIRAIEDSRKDHSVRAESATYPAGRQLFQPESGTSDVGVYKPPVPGGPQG